MKPSTQDLQSVIDHMCGKPWDTGCVWVCEEHPNLIWPHDDCAGPGMPPLTMPLEGGLGDQLKRMWDL